MSSTRLPTLAVLIGAGQRGRVYSNYALDHPELLRVVALAEPHPLRRKEVAESHGINDKARYDGWEAMMKELPTPEATIKLAAESDSAFNDALTSTAAVNCKHPVSVIAIIATPDTAHLDASLACARAGFHLLLEKPMSVTEDQCKQIAAAVSDSGVTMAVCHVLRYTPVNRLIHHLLKSKQLGDLLHIQHLEPVGASHFAHSYVRGNWRCESESASSLLAKCCHDIDLISWWMEAQGPNAPTHVASFGKRIHFRKENKPKGATDRCMSCPVESACAYSAKTIYLEPLTRRAEVAPTPSPAPSDSSSPAHPVTATSTDADKSSNELPTPISSRPVQRWYPNYLALTDSYTPDMEDLVRALNEGPYGRCVYECDNDVMDNQVVTMQFDAGQSASMTMVATTDDERTCVRQTRICCSSGEIEVVGDGHTVTITDFKTMRKTSFQPDQDPRWGASAEKIGRLSGHLGADFYLMSTFIEAIREGDQSKLTSGAEASLRSHQIVFAAEEARKESKVVDMRQRQQC